LELICAPVAAALQRSLIKFVSPQMRSCEPE
jgi:hypothetical protein